MNIFLHQCSYQHCSQEPKVETIKMYINRWINKIQYIYMCVCVCVCVYNGILFSLEYKWNSNTFCPMVEPRKQVKWSEPATLRYYMLLFIWGTKNTHIYWDWK